MLAVFGAILMVIAVIGMVVHMRGNRVPEAPSLTPLRQLAERLGLQYGPDERAKGTYDGCHIEVVLQGDAAASAATWFEAVAPGAAKITICRRAWPENVEVTATGVYTMDHRLDAFLECSGPPESVLAALDSETRQRLIELFLRGEAAVRDGVITWAREGSETVDKLEAGVRRVVNLAQALSFSQRSAAARLWDTFVAEREHPRRMRCLRLLFWAFAGSDEALTAARSIGAEHDPEARLAAATYLGDVGALLSLAESNLVPRLWRLAARRHLASLEETRSVHVPQATVGASPGA